MDLLRESAGQKRPVYDGALIIHGFPCAHVHAPEDDDLNVRMGRPQMLMGC